MQDMLWFKFDDVNAELLVGGDTEPMQCSMAHLLGNAGKKFGKTGKTSCIEDGDPQSTFTFTMRSVPAADQLPAALPKNLTRCRNKMRSDLGPC
mmetsp:Transcript_15727/g.36916  ORF Transcript_15727/g.36916 Transcript_15727/m.36916 type:complete len:94 (-) Transcript_15727:957-1238(-)